MNHQARVRVRHEEAYDFDERLGLWVRRLVFDETYSNILTNAGRVTIHTFIYGLVADRAAASLGADGLSYIALSDDATAPDPGDTSLAGELSADGLGRAQGSVTLPTGAQTDTVIGNQFTYTGGPAQGVQKTALFDATMAGNMAHEVQFAQRTLNTNDTLTVSYTISTS